MDRLGRDPDLDLVPVPADLALLERGDVDALAVASPKPAGGEPAVVTIYHQGEKPESNEARRRLRLALAEYRDQELAARFVERGQPLEPSPASAALFYDIDEPARQAAAGLGRYLPLILVALLITGGAFAAIDLVAGEKERGTLETLFIQPVHGISVTLGKYLAVLAASLGAVLFNLLGMAGAFALGLGPTGPLSGARFLPDPLGLLAGLAMVVPLAALTSAILLVVSTCARSFRQAQLFLLPLALAAMVPALLATLPDVRLSSAIAVVPVASASLAIREALAGEYRWGFLAATFGSTALYAGLALRWAASLLDREDLRLGLQPESVLEGATGPARAKRGLVFGVSMVLFTAYAGTAAQRPEGALGPWAGLAFTLWVLVLLPPLVYLKVFRLPLRETIALRALRFRDLLAVLAMVPPAAVLITAYLSFQDSVLPFPEGLRKELEKLFAMESLPPGAAILLLAVSPAICEEFLWRGVVQGELEAERRPVKAVILVGALFAFFHLSAYRLVPTMILGGILAYLRLSTGTILACILFHGLYNAAQLLAARAGAEAWAHWAARPEVAAPAAMMLLSIGWWTWKGRRERVRESNRTPDR